MYLVKTPSAVRKVFPRYLWKVDTTDKVVYLTFDDGPTPEITDAVLDVLKTHNALATFFCVGHRIASYPDIVARIKREGHLIGNHTMNHKNGKKTSNEEYLKDVQACSELIDTNLFRPPYGMIRSAQANHILQSMQVVMWDVLCGDFDERLTPEDCVKNVLTNVQEGSIVVFHDSQKAYHKMMPALKRTLEEFGDRGYRFEVLPGP